MRRATQVVFATGARRCQPPVSLRFVSIRDRPHGRLILILDHHHPLLSSPHPKSSPGTGSVDLFSEKFDSLVSDEVKGKVDSQKKSRDQFKQVLLGIHDHWDPKTATVTPTIPPVADLVE